MIVYVTLAVLLVGLNGSPAHSSTPAYDTIVIGLGSAGTTAASTLARAGRRVLALEAQDRIGGRVRTVPFGDGVIELGAEWIFGLYPSRVYDLAVQNNISVLLQDPALTVYRSDGSKTDDTLTELLNYCWEIIDNGSDLPESTGELVERKLKQYLQEQKPGLLTDKELIDRFLELVNQMVNTLEASNSFYDVAVQGNYVSLNGSLYGSWHRHGYKTFFEILLETYKNRPGLQTLNIKLNKEVTNIQWPKESTGSVLVTCRNGEQYSADNVIITMSLGVLKERHETIFSPPLPQEKITAIESMSMGLLDKIVLLFDKPWPVKEWIMFYWNAEDVKKLPAEDEWVSKIAGTSSPAGASNMLTLWLAGDAAKFEETLMDEVVKNKSTELLQRFMGADVKVPQIVAMLRSTWFTNPFTRGSYTYDNMDITQRPHRREDLAAPLLDTAGTPRLLFAGEATHSSYYGTVHGASDSGYREAQRLLSAN